MQRFLPSPLAMRVLLGLSLCLNVFFSAYLLTQYWHAKSFAMSADTPPPIIMRATERLPEADAAILWRSYRAREEKILAAQRDYRQALREGALLLRAPLVDAEALSSAFGHAKARRGAVGDLVLDVFIEAFPQMSHPGRERLVEKAMR
jgi:uncharacterized membrane protein